MSDHSATIGLLRGPKAVLCVRFSVVIFLILLPFLAACSGLSPGPTPSRDEAEIVRHHNWWNYYERAMQRLSAQDSTGAGEDLERCLNIRSGARFGNARDARRVRTYGVHYLEDYFPNREFGISLYFKGNPTSAVRYLEQSLRDAPSARAKHYLNLVRQQMIVGTHPAVPQIELRNSPQEKWTRQRTKSLQGRLTCAGYSREVTVNGRPLFLELAENDLALNESINLHEGTNEVSVIARDLAGQSSTNKLVWIADWRAPQVAIHSVLNQAGNCRISGVVIDNESLKTVLVDGRTLPGSLLTGDQRQLPFALDLQAGRRAHLLVEDMAGNQLDVDLVGDELARELACAPAPLWAQAFSVGTADVREGASHPSVDAPVDRMKPRMKLSADEEEQAVVYHHEFYLTGEASDPSGLDSISINGEDQMASSKGCKSIRFARMLALDKGTNLFEVIAADLRGNRTIRTLMVVRRESEFLDQAHRLTVALPPIEPSSMEDFARLAHGKIQQCITDRPSRFQLVERNEGLSQILIEHGISLSKMADREVQLQVQKILPAELYLIGKLLPMGRGVTLQIDVIETGSTEALFVEDVYTEESGAPLDELAAGLTLKIKQRFPLLEGVITQTSGDRVTVSLGKSHGVIPRYKFLVGRKASGEKMSGAVTLCRSGDEPVTLSVDQVARDSSRALVIPGSASKDLRQGDIVYSR